MASQNPVPTLSLKRGILKRDGTSGSFESTEPPVSDESRKKLSVRLNVADNEAIDPICNDEFPSVDEMVHKQITHGSGVRVNVLHRPV